MAIVYRHRRLDTNEVFYIGIGKNESRAFSKDGRNNYWKNTVNKYGYTVEIIQEDLTWEEACELECLLILEYGRKDLGTGSLVNMTEGGDGVVGWICSDETREKMSKARKGKIIPQETRDKIGEANKGKTPSQEAKLKMSESHKGKITSQETKLKMSKAQKGKTVSQETREKMSKSQQNRSKETIDKMRKPINQLSLDGNFIKEWSSALEVERELNLYNGNISKCCNGKLKTTAGFKWEFKIYQARINS